MTREEDLFRFVREAGYSPGDLQPLAGDASNRRYLRLMADQTFVVMDAPPDRGEDVAPFVAVTAWLRSCGYSAPEIHSADIEAGFLLLEDLGDSLFSRVCSDTPQSEAGLYTAAVDLLGEIAQGRPPDTLPNGVHLRPYDAHAILSEAMLFAEWYLPAITGASPSQDLIDHFRSLINEACADVAPARQVLVLRDYHAENLIWLPDRHGTARVGLLDYQDALAGHAAYDLVSLLEDARRDTTPELREAMLARYLAQAGVDETPFREAYCVLGAQRNLKIVGIFARLCLRDGKTRYPALIPRVWDHLMRDLSHPRLAPLASLIREHVPEPDAHGLTRMVALAGTRA